jgi:hypothetical protein
MKITHNAAAPTGAAQAELRPFLDAEIRAGVMLGITLRSALNPDTAKEFPVSLEVGMQLSHILQEYALAELQRIAQKLAESEARLASREALAAQKGGQGK